MPLDVAICFSSSLALLWSCTMRDANCFTSSLDAFCCARLPSSTSAMPPIAAFSTNAWSGLAFLDEAVAGAFVPLGAVEVPDVCAETPNARVTPSTIAASASLREIDSNMSCSFRADDPSVGARHVPRRA